MADGNVEQRAGDYSGKQDGPDQSVIDLHKEGAILFGSMPQNPVTQTPQTPQNEDFRRYQAVWRAGSLCWSSRVTHS